MTTPGMTTGCTDCNVDVQDVDITAPYDHVAVDDNDEAAGEQVRVVDDVDRSTVALPPDGGWGWMVVAAAFISNLIVGGVCYMFGIIMPELLQYFQAGKGKTAFVGSVVPGTLSIIGPVASMLVNRFGCRVVSIVGSVIAGLFFALSQFSSNIDVMILTYGVMGGIGVGLLNLPSIVIVGFYFDKRRALANGISISGTGIGTFVFAPLASYLVSEYGWKGTHMIAGAIMLNGVACGLIYLPLRASVLKPEVGTPVSNRLRHSAVQRSATCTRAASINSLSHDGTATVKDKCFVRVCQSMHAVNDDSTSLTEVKRGPPNGHATSVPSLRRHKHLDEIRSMECVSSASSMSRTESENVKKLRNQLSISPLVRQDIFYTGSVTSLREYKTCPDMDTYVQSHLNVQVLDAEPARVSRLSTVYRLMKQMFDFSLLLSPSYVVLCMSAVLPFIGLYTPAVYVYEKVVQEMGVSKAKASIILSILGIFDTCGRAASGLLADRPWTDSLFISSVATIMAGLLTCLVSVIFSFELICVYAAFYSVFIASFIALRPIVIVDLLGIQKLTDAFGLTSLFQGIACLIGTPLSGAILDATGSFVGPFVVAGCVMAVGGLLGLPARRIARWEQRRNDRRIRNDEI